MISRSTCGSGGCVSCPFSNTDESYEAENSGCLPDTFNIMSFPEKYNVNWGCHGETGVVCGGFVKEITRQGKQFDKSLPIVDFDEYTHLGLDVAVALAKVRKGINPLKDATEGQISIGSVIHFFDYTNK